MYKLKFFKEYLIHHVQFQPRDLFYLNNIIVYFKVIINFIIIIIMLLLCFTTILSFQLAKLIMMGSFQKAIFLIQSNYLYIDLNSFLYDILKNFTFLLKFSSAKFLPIINLNGNIFSLVDDN